MLLDELRDNTLRHRIQLKLIQPALRNHFLDQIANRCCLIVSGQPLPTCHDDLGKAVSKKMMLVGALFGDHPFNDDSEAVAIATTLSFNQVEKQVSAHH